MTEEYIEVSKLGAAYAKGLIEVWEKMGRPDDVSVSSGWIVLDQIVAVWQKAFTAEAEAWRLDRRDDLDVERSVQAHLKGGGYNPITYPPSLYQMIKALLPGIKLNDKKFQKALANRHPLFKTTNLKL